MITRTFLVWFCVALSLPALSQFDSLYLYPEGVPGAIPSPIPERTIVNPNDGVSLVTDVQKPMLYIHKPAHANGAAVLICPGGGYMALAMDHEGHNLARWFNKRGITAFVLKSRLPNDALMTHKSDRPLQDAQQAMRIIRTRGKQWNVDTSKIGIMGFSAGGHLAAMAGTHFRQVGEITDRKVSVRPDFMILVYPMISFQPGIFPDGMENKLLGPNPSLDDINAYSVERQVTPQTPPTFIILAADDFLSPKNSLSFFAALLQHKVPAELHIYEKGGHGFSLTKKQRGHVEEWDREMEGWLRDRGLIQNAKVNNQNAKVNNQNAKVKMQKSKKGM